MDVKQLVDGLKEKGLNDEQIKEELLKIKADIDAFLNPKPQEEQKPAEEKPAEAQESDADKEKRIFGNL